MTTTIEEKLDADEALEALEMLTPKEARARLFQDLEAKLGQSERFYLRFGAILKCKASGLEDKDDVLHTAVKFKTSAFEYGTKVSLGVKLAGGDLTALFKTRKHYVLQLREAPTTPDGKTVNLKLDGEITSLLVTCVHIGRQMPTKADGDVVSVLDFKIYKGEEGDEDSSGGCTLQVLMEGELLQDRFELGNVYRMALRQAPKWLENQDKRRREQELEAKAERARMREEKAQAKEKQHPEGTLPLPLGNVTPGAGLTIAGIPCDITITRGGEEQVLDQVVLESGRLMGWVATELAPSGYDREAIENLASDVQDRTEEGTNRTYRAYIVPDAAFHAWQNKPAESEAFGGAGLPNHMQNGVTIERPNGVVENYPFAKPGDVPNDPQAPTTPARGAKKRRN